MKIYDVVIHLGLQFARDGEDFQARKKLSASTIAFWPRESVCDSGCGEI